MLNKDEKMLEGLRSLIDLIEGNRGQAGTEKAEFYYDEDEAKLENINDQLAEVMEINGFESQSTGGGCWGWFKNLLPDGSMYLQITVGDSQLGYDNLAEVHQEQICACVYIDQEWQDQTLRYYTFADFLAAFKEG